MNRALLLLCILLTPIMGFAQAPSTQPAPKALSDSTILILPIEPPMGSYNWVGRAIQQDMHVDLTQITRDQTMAQELADQGVMTESAALSSRWAHVLSSSIGGQQTAPVVTRMSSDWDNVHLMSSDGLTKHVSHEQIAERLRTMQSAKQVCETLLQDALDGGGTDNISLIAARTIAKT